MAETHTQPEPPTFYANVVTASVDPDVMYLEFRRLLVPHVELRRRATELSSTGVAHEMPSPGEEEIYALDPIARVVITYSAVKVLQAELSELIPKMELARKGSDDRK